ncbi:MAG TPA: FecR family protein [Bryobacteraceae bacterium]|jgi:FecR protein|nr:FecR family protein [Bryobacteraceae bacterium]
MRRSGNRGFIGALLVFAATGICSAQLFPQSSAAAAKVVSLTGQVSVLRDTEPWALNVGDMVQTQQVILTGPDGYAKFETSDGSTFEVYPSSNVIFRKNPGSLQDLLDLFVGRVKIHIQRLGGQPNPNRIMTPTAVISVRGTIFDVSINDDDETTIVSVEEGSVEVRHALKPGAAKIVNAGESIHVYRDEPLAKSLIDKNELFHRIVRGLADAAYRIAIDPPGRISLPGGGGGGVGCGVCTGEGHGQPPPPVGPPAGNPGAPPTAPPG